MRVVICRDYEEMSRVAADIFVERIKAKPDIILGLATGATPERLYELLAEKNRAGEIDFAKVRTFNLDEYVGLKPTHDQSYRHFMNDKLFDHVNLDKANTRVLNGVAESLFEECRKYEEEIRTAGGIDLQLLGIGSNGHIAFNEPGSARYSRTRVVQLKESTIQDNSRFFASADEVPRQALSMGMASVMEAKEVVLVANKASKADAVAAAIEGPASIDCPASLLQEHPNATIIVDEAAAGKLVNRASYEVVTPAEEAVESAPAPQVTQPVVVPAPAPQVIRPVVVSAPAPEVAEPVEEAAPRKARAPSKAKRAKGKVQKKAVSKKKAKARKKAKPKKKAKAKKPKGKK